jgi:PAS domain S-box-containing protein
LEELLSRGLRPPTWRRFGFALFSSFSALLARAAFEPWLASAVPYQFFFLAVIASSVYGGTAPGLVATVLGGIWAVGFIFPPFGSFEIPSLSYLVGLLLYFAVGASISLLGGWLHRSKIREAAGRMHYEQTLLGIGDAVLSTDADGQVLLMNRVAEELTGIPVSKARGQHLNEVVRFVREGGEEPVENPIQVVLKTGGIVGLANHTDILRNDGSRTPVDDSAAPVRDAEGNLIGAVLVFRDVSGRRQAEKKLEAAERQCRALLESIADCFVSVDADRNLTYANAVAEERFHLSAESSTGKPLRGLIPQFDTPEIAKALDRAIREGQTTVVEGFAASNGCWYDLVFYPHEEGASLYIRDITSRKRREDELRQANEDLRHFSFAASHDLREPLRTMTLFVELIELRHRANFDDQDRAQIRDVLSAGRRIDHLVRRLLEYTRVRDSLGVVPVPVDANQCLADALRDLAASIDEAQAEFSIGPLPGVLMEPTHLYQVFQNLISNALKYRRPGEVCRIAISSREEENLVTVSVEDNGIGIPAEYAESVFAPFSRLHGPEVSGAGIGLATCRRILDLFGGRIWIQPQERGTKICFCVRPAGTRERAAGA